MNTRHLFIALLAVTGILTIVCTAAAQDVGSDVPRPPADTPPPSARPAPTPTDAASSRILDEEMALQGVIWSKAKAYAVDLMNRAQLTLARPSERLSELTASDFAQARELLKQAEERLRKDEYVAVPAELAAMRKQIADQRAHAANLEEQVNVQRAHDDKTRAELLARKHAEEVATLQRERIDELMNQVLKARMQNENATVIRLLEEILKIDTNTNNPAVRAARWMLDDTKITRDIRDQASIDHQQNEWRTKSYLGLRGAMVAYDNPIVYPSADVWHELIERRKDFKAGLPPEPPANQRVKEILEQQIPEIRFPAVTFEAALDALRTLRRVNINPNWAAIENVGVTKATEITLQLRDVTFETALRELLAKAAGQEGKLDYVVKDGVIKVSSVEDLSTLKYILVYDVRDLLHPLTDFTVPKVSAGATHNNDSDDDDDNTIGFDDDDDAVDDGTGSEENRQEKVEGFLTLLRTTVLPESWAGGEASVTETDGLLVVKQSAQGHRELAKLLGQLREHSRMQITIEARFLTIESQFLEDIGFDLDFIFNRRGTNHWSAIPVNTDTFGDGRPNSAGSFLGPGGDTVLSPVGAADIFQISRSAFVAAGSFVDDIQVDFFLRATQAHRQSTRLNSLRVTLLNGHEAYCRVETAREYVSDLNPSVGTGVVGYDPETSELVKGISFGVRATVTADRKYVIMTVKPTLQDGRLVEPFKFQTGNIGTQVVTDPASPSLTSVNNVAQELEVQLKESDVQEVRTTVMVPDQGTLLLGGQRLADELEIETGVPILSKIPIIKRAFTSRNFVKRERSTLMLIRPQILIPDELEP